MANQPSITAKAGTNFLLKVSDGASPTTYSTVGGLRATGIQINDNPVDISNKGSAGWRELLPDGGLATLTFTGAGIVDSGATSAIVFRRVMAAAFARTMLECQIVSGHGDKVMGLFAIASFGRDAPHDNVETFTITLESSGPPVYSQA